MYEKQIQAGSEYLDKVCPGWEKKIDLDRLDINNTEDCIIGQVFGNYWTWMTEGLGSWEEAEEMGFCGNDYKTLTEEWREFIRERLTAA